MASTQSGLEKLSVLSYAVEEAVTVSQKTDLETDPAVTRAIAERRTFVLEPASGIDPLDAWLVLSFPCERIPRLRIPFYSAHSYLLEHIGAPVLACRFHPPAEEGARPTYSLLTGNLAGGFKVELPTESDGLPRLFLPLEQDGYLLEGEMITLGPRPMLDFPTGEPARCRGRDWPITVADLESALLRNTGPTLLFNITAGDRDVVDFLIRFCVQDFEERCHFPAPEELKAAERLSGMRAGFIISQT